MQRAAAGVAIAVVAAAAFAVDAALVERAPRCIHPHGADGGPGPGPDSCTFIVGFDDCLDADARLSAVRSVEMVDGWVCDDDCGTCTVATTVVDGDVSAVRAAIEAAR